MISFALGYSISMETTFSSKATHSLHIKKMTFYLLAFWSLFFRLIAGSSLAFQQISSKCHTSTVFTQVSTAVSSGSPASSTTLHGVDTSKRGVSYNEASLANLFSGNVSWAYNWGSSPDGTLSMMTYIPLLWNDQSSATATWTKNAMAAIDAGADTLLSFNEPDLSTQANMSPSRAATSFKTFMEPFALGSSETQDRKARLATPAVSNSANDGEGLSWLSSFINACSSCSLDVVAIHWYNSATSIDDFKNHVRAAYVVGGYRPIWITEFGVTSGSQHDINVFLEAALPWLNEQVYIERYAYFWAAEGYLVSSGALSPTGKEYVSIQ
jgi:hypothetical protein